MRAGDCVGSVVHIQNTGFETHTFDTAMPNPLSSICTMPVACSVNVFCTTRKARNFTETVQILAVLNNSVCASTCRRLRFDGSEAIEASVQTGLRLWFCLGTGRCGFGWLGDWQLCGFAWRCVFALCLCAD